MHVSKCTLLLSAVVSVAALTGCATNPNEDMLGIVFQNKWLGDIDQVQFPEPSGICWHTQRKTLFVVGDEGDICEIETDGALIRQKKLRPGADFEGITHNPATGLLYVAVEGDESVLEVDPESFDVLREFSLPRQFEGKMLMAPGKEGIEAITFVPRPEHPQGGFFFVANQAFTLSDRQDISALFQVELPLKDKQAGPRITGYYEPGVIDIAGLYYDAKRDRLLAVSDSTNILLEYSSSLELLRFYAFPGDNQEGITVDPDGHIYIAQDTGGVLKLKMFDW